MRHDDETVNKKTIKLSGSLPGTASFVRITDAGDLEAEFYDHSSRAQDAFGGDVAYLMTVAASDLPALQEALGGDAQRPLLERIDERFASYYDLKGWLEERGILFRKRFDSQA